MRYVDLSHTIWDGLVTYKGLPAPVMCDYLAREDSVRHYEDGTTFHIGKVEMVGNTGTYIDCPFHRYEDGKDFSDYFVSDLVDLPGVVIDCPFTRQLDVDIQQLSATDVRGKAVLIKTGWSAHWNTESYFENHPFLTESASTWLLDQGALLVGIDSHNIDDTRGNSRPAHSILLGAGIPIVEHMCQLHVVPDDNFYFSALPPKMKGMGSFPVRAYARF